MYIGEEEEEEEEEEYGSTYTHIVRQYLVLGFLSGYVPFLSRPPEIEKKTTRGYLFGYPLEIAIVSTLLAICLPSLGSLCSLGDNIVS